MFYVEVMRIDSDSTFCHPHLSSKHWRVHCGDMLILTWIICISTSTLHVCCCHSYALRVWFSLWLILKCTQLWWGKAFIQIKFVRKTLVHTLGSICTVRNLTRTCFLLFYVHWKHARIEFASVMFCESLRLTAKLWQVTWQYMLFALLSTCDSFEAHCWVLIWSQRGSNTAGYDFSVISIFCNPLACALGLFFKRIFN